MLIPDSVTTPALPARSVARPVTEWFATSVDNVTGAVRLPGATSDSASLAEKVTVTGLLFQPAALAAGEGEAITTGAVLSMFTVRLAVAVFPDLSVAVPEIT